MQRAFKLVRSRAQKQEIAWSDTQSRDRLISSLGADNGRATCFVHLHGIASDPDGIVLTDSDYLRQYVQQEETRRLLFAVFATKTVVFVWFGMQDPELMQLLRTVASSLTCRQSTHFAIMPFKRGKQDAQWIRDRLISKYQIVPIFYPAVRAFSRWV